MDLKVIIETSATARSYCFTLRDYFTTWCPVAHPIALSTLRTIGTCFRTGLLSAFLFCSKVWIGQVGSSGVQRLKSSALPRKLSPDLYEKRDSSTLSIFFDSGGGLQQVSDKCPSRVG